MQSNLADLVRKCESLGLVLPPQRKKPGKAEYVALLKAHYMPAEGIPYPEITPMLCFPSWDMEPKELDRVWDSPEWVAQEKMNGCRLLLHAVEGKGWYCHSRTISLKTYRFEELTENTLLSEVEPPPFTGSFDCEVMIDKPIDTTGYTSGGKGAVTKTSLHSTTAVLHLEAGASRRLQKEQKAPLMFRIFDMLSFNGDDLREQPLSRRLGLLEVVKERFDKLSYHEWFDFPDYQIGMKKLFHATVIAKGGEGTILKNLKSPYIDSSSRLRTGWLKVKKRREYDAFVSGFLRGEPGSGWENLVGALEFSVNTEKGRHVIGYASNVSLENRKKITIFDEAAGTVKMIPGIYGKVAEISGQDITARVLRLSHCTIDRWRSKTGPDGKRAEDCVCSYADLVAASAWVG